MLKVAVTGGRDYEDASLVEDTLRMLYVQEGEFTLLHGGAPGVDSFAKQWAIDSGFTSQEFPANWAAFGKAAGPIRNRDMVREADMLIAFPGGRGTADCIKAATMAGVPVFLAVPIKEDETNGL